MPEFLSEEWITSLDEAVGASAKLRAAALDLADVLVIQQRVDSEPPTTYHIVIGGRQEPAVRPGPASRPTVTFNTDRDTAAAVSRGDQSAQAAFMVGRLRVGGSVDDLMRAQPVLAALDDVFAGVRARTTY